MTYSYIMYNSLNTEEEIIGTLIADDMNDAIEKAQALCPNKMWTFLNITKEIS